MTHLGFPDDIRKYGREYTSSTKMPRIRKALIWIIMVEIAVWDGQAAIGE